jgi:hypothetical protein
VTEKWRDRLRLALIIGAGFVLAVALTAVTYWIWPPPPT